MLTRFLPSLFLFLLLCSPALLTAAQKPNDREALAGVKTARVIFDVRVHDLEKLVFNLQLIDETFEGMAAQRVIPKMVVAFRGAGVRLLTTAELDDEALGLIRILKKKGVRIEACALAMRTFKVDPAGLSPEITIVANVLNSLIGYQNKGYALVVLN